MLPDTIWRNIDRGYQRAISHDIPGKYCDNCLQYGLSVFVAEFCGELSRVEVCARVRSSAKVASATGPGGIREDFREMPPERSPRAVFLPPQPHRVT